MLKKYKHARLQNEIAIENIEKICSLKNYRFLYFCDKSGNECDYENNKTHLKLYCDKCGKYWTSATYNRFTCGGTNCPNCLKIKEEDAIVKITNICKSLNYTFLYFCDKNGTKTEWAGSHTHLFLHCNNCGNEWYGCSYDNFIRGRKCPKCKSYFREAGRNSFLKRCKEKNWEIIGYFNEENKDVGWEKCTKIRLKCLNCGFIWDKSKSLIYGKAGCPNCAKKLIGEMHKTKENKCLPKILELCDKRNYKFLGYCDRNGDDAEWHGSSTYLKLQCLNCGQIWKTCTYYNFTHHLRGCPKCKQSHLETEIRDLLLQNGIMFQEQKRFEWLGQKSLDFFIPTKNIAIECQGKQHFIPVEPYGGEDEFEKIKIRDCDKKSLCEQNGITLLYFSNLKIKYPYEVIEDKDILLNKIAE